MNVRENYIIFKIDQTSTVRVKQLGLFCNPENWTNAIPGEVAHYQGHAIEKRDCQGKLRWAVTLMALNFIVLTA